MAGSCEEKPECTKPPAPRTRWNANPHQLQHLERMFEEGNGSTPTKQSIKDIALDLAQFGSISDSNVYNWFQNRKARAKRRLQQRLHGRTSIARGRLGHRSGPSPAALHAAAAAAALQLSVGKVIVTGEEVGVTSPQAERFKSQELDCHHNDVNVDLSETSCLNDASNSELGAASSTLGLITDAFDEKLRSHVHYAAPLATHPTHDGDIARDNSLLFNEVHFHEQVHGKACDDDLVRSFSSEESSHIIRDHSLSARSLHLLSAPEDDILRSLDLRFRLAGDKLSSLARAFIPLRIVRDSNDKKHYRAWASMFYFNAYSIEAGFGACIYMLTVQAMVGPQEPGSQHR